MRVQALQVGDPSQFARAGPSPLHLLYSSPPDIPHSGFLWASILSRLLLSLPFLPRFFAESPPGDSKSRIPKSKADCKHFYLSFAGFVVAIGFVQVFPPKT